MVKEGHIEERQNLGQIKDEGGQNCIQDDNRGHQLEMLETMKGWNNIKSVNTMTTMIMQRNWQSLNLIAGIIKKESLGEKRFKVVMGEAKSLSNGEQ